MELDASLEIFASMGKQLDQINGHMDRWNRCKPIHYTVGGSAISSATSGSECDLYVDDMPAYGRIWNLQSVNINAPTLAASEFSPNSSSGSGSVTSPGAAALIAQTTFLTEGYYTVTVTTFLDGTVAAADTNNMQISQGSSTPTLPVPPVINVPVTTSYVEFYTQNQRAKVSSIAAGTAGAIYNATITATPVTSLAAAAGMSADVYLGQNQLTPDVSSQILDNSTTLVPGIYYFPRKALWSKRGDTIFARVYQVPATTQLTISARIAEYPLEAVEALSV